MAELYTGQGPEVLLLTDGTYMAPGLPLPILSPGQTLPGHQSTLATGCGFSYLFPSSSLTLGVEQVQSPRGGETEGWAVSVAKRLQSKLATFWGQPLVLRLGERSEKAASFRGQLSEGCGSKSGPAASPDLRSQQQESQVPGTGRGPLRPQLEWHWEVGSSRTGSG